MVACKLEPPSASPLGGSRTYINVKMTDKIPKPGVICNRNKIEKDIIEEMKVLTINYRQERKSIKHRL